MSKSAELEYVRDGIRAGQVQRFFQTIRPKFEKFEYSDEDIMGMLNALPCETMSTLNEMLNEYPVGKVPVHLFALVNDNASAQHFEDLKTYLPLLDYRHFETIYALQHYRTLEWFPSVEGEDVERVTEFMRTMAFLVHSVAYAPHKEKALEAKRTYLVSRQYGFPDDSDEYLILADERVPKLVYENPDHRVKLICTARERCSLSYDLLNASLETHTVLTAGTL